MKKYLFGILAMLFAVAAISFTTLSSVKQTTITRYHYTSNSTVLADVQNINNWVAEEPGCPSTGDLPCAIDYDGDSAAFATYLGGFTSVQAITDVAVQKKSS